MRFTLGQLEALLWVVRLGSFHAAAAHLNLTQPAISVRVRELEATVGGALFLRDSYRARPTALGREVAGQAERVIAACEALEGRVGVGEELRGPVRIGAADTFAMDGLSELMRRIEARFPKVRVEIRVDFSAVLNDSLHAGDLDIAVLTSPSAAPLIVIEPLMALELLWMASPRLALGKGPFSPAELAAMPIITNPNPSQLFTSITAWFAAAGVRPERVSTCNSLVIMGRLASQGAGISLLPEVTLRPELEAGTLEILPVTPRVPPHMMAVAYRRDARGSGLAEVAQMVHALAQESEARAYTPRPRRGRS